MTKKKKLKPANAFGKLIELRDVEDITIEFNPKDFVEVWGDIPTTEEYLKKFDKLKLPKK